MMYDRTIKKNMIGVIQMDDFNALPAQIFALIEKKQNLETETWANAQATQVMSYDFCGNNQS